MRLRAEVFSIDAPPASSDGGLSSLHAQAPAGEGEMNDVSATVTPEEFIDIATLRILDLRSLAQDEIRCLAHLCGDLPAHLQDAVNVIVDKSIFNESAGSRRQTYDRDRPTRNKERRVSSGSASAQLHLAIESAGRSHKDLIIHLCRQLKISERGDRAMYQPQVAQPSGVVAEGNRTISLKRMARDSASLAEIADGAFTPLSKGAAEVLVNGKELAMEVLHRHIKKVKTKEEARRKASELQEDNQALPATSLCHNEIIPLKDIPARGVTSLAQFQNKFRSPGPSHEPYMGGSFSTLSVPCSTCNRSFANVYSLRRHSASTGHVLDKMFEIVIVRKKKKKVVVDGTDKITLLCSCGMKFATPYTLKRHAKRNGHAFELPSTSQSTAPIPSLPCSCGMYFSTPYTLKRHAKRNGHAFELPSPPQLTLPAPADDHHQEVVKAEEVDGHPDLKSEKQKLGTALPNHALKSGARRFNCRQCHQQFVHKKLFIRHMSTHLQRKKSKTGANMSGSFGEVKVRRGRPPKLNRYVDIKQGKDRGKRKRELASLDGRSRSRQIAGYTPPSKKIQNRTCEECGKVFDELFRFTGHLSMHSKLRRMGVGETSTPASATPPNMIDLRETSALGYRKLLIDKSGTYLSSLPAKLLFSGSDLATEQ